VRVGAREEFRGGKSLPTSTVYLTDGPFHDVISKDWRRRAACEPQLCVRRTGLAGGMVREKFGERRPTQ
jgi:hypothetical protein